jgi:hypothetical protein
MVAMLPRPSVDLLEFFRTGRFDCVRLGQTQEEIVHNFAAPDDFSPDDLTRRDSSRMTIWRYGNVELHFEGPRLFLIFSDYIGTLDGGSSMALEKWILAEPDRLTLPEVIRALCRERIDFSKRTGSLGEVKLELTSGVTLHFDMAHESGAGAGDQNEMRLSAFALMRSG